jgi:hypothetical protein
MKQEFLLDTLQKLDGLTRQLSVVNNSVAAQEPAYVGIESPALTSAPNDKVTQMVRRLPPRKPNPPVLDAHKVVEMEALISYAKQLVGNIQTCTEHQGLITNNVLDLTRLDAGKVEPIFDVVDVRALGQQIVQMMSSKAQRKQLDLSMSGGGLPPLYLKADATILRQVLLNLVSNAIKVGSNLQWITLYLTEPLVHPRARKDNYRLVRRSSKRQRPNHPSWLCYRQRSWHDRGRTAKAISALLPSQ